MELDAKQRVVHRRKLTGFRKSLVLGHLPPPV
jgi:hypothetical protein